MCPDCNAEQRLVEIKPNVYVLQLFHDDTCPAYRQKQGKRRASR